MNLQSQFPEIHKFFDRQQFDSVQLEDLLKKIKLDYPEPEIYRKAEQFVKFELFKFEIQSQNKQKEPHREVNLKYPNNKKTRSKSNSNESVLNSSNKRKKELKPLIKVVNETTFPRGINNLSIKLKLSLDELHTLCQKKEVNIKNTVKLSEEELNLLTPLFQNRIGEIRAKERKTAKIEKSNEEKPKIQFKQRNNTGDVFDKIATYGLGKLIYIRSK